MQKIIDDAPVSIRQISPETPVWMIALIEKLMAKKKEDRFATAKEVHTLLDACLSHVQQPSSNPIPSLHANNQTSTAKKKPMRLIAGIGFAMIVMLFGMAQLRFNYLNTKALGAAL